MKRLLCVLFAMVTLSCAAFAQMGCPAYDMVTCFLATATLTPLNGPDFNGMATVHLDATSQTWTVDFVPNFSDWSYVRDFDPGNTDSLTAVWPSGNTITISARFGMLKLMPASPICITMLDLNGDINITYPYQAKGVVSRSDSFIVVTISPISIPSRELQRRPFKK